MAGVSAVGIRYFLAPDPFNSGYVPLQPMKVELPIAPPPETDFQVIQVESSTGEELKAIIPDFIPTLKVSEQRLDNSATSLTIKNMTTKSFTVKLSPGNYSFEIAPGFPRTVYLPAREYQLATIPPLNTGVRNINIKPNTDNLGCLYSIKSSPSEPPRCQFS